MSKSGLIIIFSLLIAYSFKGFGQEMHGYVHSNNAGITGAQINPTAIVNSKRYFDLTIIGAHIHGDNDYIYLSKNEYRLSQVPKENLGITPHIGANGKTRIFYDFYDESLKNGFIQARIMGPSAMYAINDKAFGISTSFRSMASASDIPYEIAKFGVEGFRFMPLHKIRYTNNKDFRAAALSFAEIAATYAQVIHKQAYDHWTAGITVKGLMGFAGGYWYVDNVDYIIPDNINMQIQRANGRAGFALPINYDNNDVTFPDNLIKGTGLGFDLGITYQYKEQGHSNKKYQACEQPFEDYYYKVGFSLIDIGYIKLKKNVRQITLNEAEGIWRDFTNDRITENLNVLFNSLETDLDQEGRNEVTTDEEPFSVYLPAAASLQFDWRYNPNVYINASAVIPLILHDNSLVRPATVAVTPRLEYERFELALPITLYNYKYPRIGLSARISNLVVGTDKLGGFFGINNFTGLDFYFMFKIALTKGNCIGKAKGVSCSNHEYRQYQRNQKRLKIR